MHILSHMDWFIHACTALWKVHDTPGPRGAYSFSQKRIAFQGQELQFQGEKFCNWHQKYFGKQLCSKLKNKWEMYALKRHTHKNTLLLKENSVAKTCKLSASHSLPRVNKDHWSWINITNTIIRKLELLLELAKCGTEIEGEQMLLGKWRNRLAQWRVVANFQSVIK